MAEHPTEQAQGAEEPPGEPGGQLDADAFMRLSIALREAFEQVTKARLHPDESARWQRRLIAVTNVAKRDLARALEQMERFETDWRKRRR